MSSNFQKVKIFHQTYGMPILEKPAFPTDARIDLRLSLIGEEYDELLNASVSKNILDVADALTDLLYVVYGMGLEFGINLDKCFEEVHLSNMSKLGIDGKPIYREDGKVLKGPNFRQPDLKRILFE